MDIGENQIHAEDGKWYWQKKRHVWKLKSGSKISRREEDEKDKTIVAARYDGEGFLVCVGAEGKLSRYMVKL